MESEAAGLQQEKDALEALHNKMADLETKSQQEKDKVLNTLWFIVNKREGRFSTIHDGRLRDLEPVKTPVGKIKEDAWKCNKH